MIRIVGVQRSENVDQEFLLLQNQGAMRLTLKGHAVVGEGLFEGGGGRGLHFFTDDVAIGPGQFVVLHSGPGRPRWSVTRDGTNVYNAYMGSPSPVWDGHGGSIRVLGTQHTYAERREAFLAV